MGQQIQYFANTNVRFIFYNTCGREANTQKYHPSIQTIANNFVSHITYAVNFLRLSGWRLQKKGGNAINKITEKHGWAYSCSIIRSDILFLCKQLCSSRKNQIFQLCSHCQLFLHQHTFNQSTLNQRILHLCSTLAPGKRLNYYKSVSDCFKYIDSHTDTHSTHLCKNKCTQIKVLNGQNRQALYIYKNTNPMIHHHHQSLWHKKKLHTI